MKKGMEMSTLVVIIVALAGLLVMGYSLKSIADVTQGTTDKQVCKQSIELRATTKLKFISETQTIDIPIKCKSKNDFIKNENDFKKINQIIANDMYDCWDQFGEGKLDFLFSRDFFDNTYCFVCSKISVANTSLQNKDIIGLGDYLKNEEIPNLGQTYANFLYPEKVVKEMSSFTTNSLSIQDYLNNFNKIPIKEPIYILYAVKRTSIPKLSLLGSGVGLGGLCTLALFTGVFTAPGAVCLVGTIGLGVASAYSPNTYYYPSLILGNSQEVIARCQQK